MQPALGVETAKPRSRHYPRRPRYSAHFPGGTYHCVSTIHSVNDPDLTLRLNRHAHDVTELDRAGAGTPEGTQVCTFTVKFPQLVAKVIKHEETPVRPHFDRSDFTKNVVWITVKPTQSKHFLDDPASFWSPGRECKTCRHCDPRLVCRWTVTRSFASRNHKE